MRGFFENGGKHCLVVPVKDVDGSETMLQALANLFHPESPLEDITDIDLVCAPDIMMQSLDTSLSNCLKTQKNVLKHCAEMEDRFAILDGPPGYGPNAGEDPSRSLFSYNRVEQIIRWLSDLPQRGREVEGAMYFPWIYVKPFARHRDKIHVPVPACGHVAGIYARSDAACGVHKAPANEVVEGAVDLTLRVSDAEQIELNNVGINCLRSFPGRGIRVWGARTLSTQPAWKYVNVRRLFITLRRWIEHNMADVVYEPNEPSLWDRVCDRIGAYCFELYQRGALKGERPAEAFFVKCNAETNPLESREEGRLICEIGLAPLAPAEFIIVRIAQSSAGTSGTILTSM